MISISRHLTRVLALALLVGFVAAPAAIASDSGDGYTDIHRLGTRAAIDREATTTLAELRERVAEHRDELTEALAQADLGHLAPAFFSAVEGAEAAELPTGQLFHWMVFRKKGKPALTENARWVGKEAFPGWAIEVSEGGKRYDFVIPQACLNLALRGVEDIPPAPTCQIKASTCDAHDATIEVQASGSAAWGSISGITLTATAPSGTSQSHELSGSRGSWSFPASGGGDYRFTCVATHESGARSETGVAVSTCPDKPIPPKPVCNLDVRVDPETREVHLDAGGSVGDVEAFVTAPDGSRQSLGTGSTWTYAPAKKGEYTFSAVATDPTGYHAPASCGDETMALKRARTARRAGGGCLDGGNWILRGYGAQVNPGGDRVKQARADNSERFAWDTSDGTGLGLGLERVLGCRLGLEIAALFADLDSQLEYDTATDWVHDDQDISFRPLTLGLNYHLTPDSRVDVFIGPFIGLAQFDDATYNVLGRSFTVDADDTFTWGLQLGVDIPFVADGPWAFTGAVKYFDLDLEGSGLLQDFEVGIDPTVLAAGIAYRF